MIKLNKLLFDMRILDVIEKSELQELKHRKNLKKV